MFHDLPTVQRTMRRLCELLKNDNILLLSLAPLQSWGPSFSFSVWFVELRGVVEEGRVKEALRWYEEVGRDMHMCVLPASVFSFLLCSTESVRQCDSV